METILVQLGNYYDSKISRNASAAFDDWLRLASGRATDNKVSYLYQNEIWTATFREPTDMSHRLRHGAAVIRNNELVTGWRMIQEGFAMVKN